MEKTKLLLKQGANVHIKNEKGLTPLDLATQQNNKSIAQFLKENKAKTSLEIKVQLAVLVTLIVITIGLALVVYFIMEGYSRNCCKKNRSHFQLSKKYRGDTFDAKSIRFFIKQLQIQ
ncbi:ankyrin repeat domain-containing protein [Wolbachia pipientis]|uniref:ankyrin repeat domain-containing protein n=1 Tax=Wolbachia pipientis TaxID=955 RepID=UPI0033651C04